MPKIFEINLGGGSEDTLYFVAIHIALPLILQKINPKDFEVIYIMTPIFPYLNKYCYEFPLLCHKACVNVFSIHACSQQGISQLSHQIHLSFRDYVSAKEY